MPREFSRNQRLGSQMLRTLNELVRRDSDFYNDVKDMFFKDVWSGLRGRAGHVPDEAAEGLSRASGFLRSKLGSSLKVRKVPELRFVHDDSVAHAVEISRLIDDANRSVEPDGQE